MTTNQQNPLADWFKAFGTPAFDINQVLSANRQMVETVVALCQTVSTGTQDAARQQLQAAREHVELSINTAKRVLAGPPDRSAAEQIDYVRQSMSSFGETTGKVADVMLKTGSDAFQLLKNRMEQNVASFGNGAAASNASNGSKRKAA